MFDNSQKHFVGQEGFVSDSRGRVSSMTLPGCFSSPNAEQVEASNLASAGQRTTTLPSENSGRIFPIAALILRHHWEAHGLLNEQSLFLSRVFEIRFL